MASFVGGAPVTLNGQTWVTVVAAPGAATQRQVLSVTVRNLDTVQHSYEMRKLKGATPYDLESPVVVQPGKGGQLVSACVVLAATDESLQVRSAEATTTTESQADPSIFEVP